MEILLWIIVGWLVWCVIGCGVLAAIDTNDQRLFKWAKECPVPFGYELTVTAWPAILYLWLNDKRRA